MTNHDLDPPCDELADPDGTERVPYCDVEVFRLEAECGKALEAFIRKRLRDDPDTVKVVERCWVDLVRKWKKDGALAEPRALLFRLAQQRSTDRIRQVIGRQETSVGDPQLLDEAAGALMASTEFASALVVRVDVRAALTELPARQRQALLIIYGYDLPYRDAAALMACTVTQLGNLLRAGKASLRQSRHLSGYLAPAPPEVTK